MDDFAIDDARLARSLHQLRFVNRYLGGYSAALAELRRVRATCNGLIRILDLGCGIADYAEVIAQWASALHPPLAVEILATDANPATVAYASRALDLRLPPAIRRLISVEVADARSLSFDDKDFDIVLASMFLHHFDNDDVVRIIGEMDRVARQGIVVNDLLRHPVAYYAISAITNVLPATPMVRHDGPLSVLRAFTPGELSDLARVAGLARFRLSRRWAYRLVLSTVGMR